jgi:septum formation protein
MIHILLKDKKVVLASNSPRRKLLLEMLGLHPLVIPANVHEPVTDDPPYRQAMNHARNKALAIAGRMDADCVVVAADTIVVLDRQILGKPRGRAQAREYLNLLSGRIHKVYTGICVSHKGAQLCAYERSSVRFAPLSEAEIEEYVSGKEPMDKAGAYGIQGFGSQFVTEVRGCYFNVMGFPINLFYNLLKQMFKSDALINTE